MDLGGFDQRREFAFAEGYVSPESTMSVERVADPRCGCGRTGRDPLIPQPIADQPGRGLAYLGRAAVREDEHEQPRHGFSPVSGRAGGVLENLRYQRLSEVGPRRAAPA